MSRQSTRDLPNCSNSPGLTEAVKACEKQLGSRGRVVLRASGTEPLIRVMVEGEDEARVGELARELADQISVFA